VLLAAGTETYRHGADFPPDGLGNLSAVPRELQSVVDILTGFGYTHARFDDKGYLLDPSLPDLKNKIRAAADSGAPVVVIYYTGHGLKPTSLPFYLLTTESKPGQKLDDDSLPASKILELVLRWDGDEPAAEQPQVLVILDCCFSGSVGREALKDALQDVGNPNVWFLASAGTAEYSEQGRFVAALSKALQHPGAGVGRFLSLEWITKLINNAFKEAEVDQEAHKFNPLSGDKGLPPFFPNPNQNPGLAGLTRAEQQYWVSRLRGLPADRGTEGFYVTGRTGRIRVIEELAGWMGAWRRSGLAVVTGSPGSGKSTMLALPVLLSNRQRGDPLVSGPGQASLVAQAAHLFADLPVLGIYARGMDTYQVARAIAKHLGLSAQSPSQLRVFLKRRRETSSVIVVADAVDEALEPETLLGDLVKLARLPGLWVVVGTRRRVFPEGAEPKLLIDLDSAPYRDPEALTEYARQLLVAAHEPDVRSPYRDHRNAITVAAGIADKATERPVGGGQAESFLLAQLLARAVRGREQVLDVKPGWKKQLPAGVGVAFDEDLHRLEREATARALLAALAWAKGPGLPWETIWVPVAQALATLAGTSTLHLDDLEDVQWLLDNAPAYVVEDLAPGGPVFRLVHDMLAAHLRGDSSHDWQHRRSEAEKAIYKALRDTVPGAGRTLQDWADAHPYLRSYLAQHAAAAGIPTLVALAKNKNFLAVADPVALSGLLAPAVPELRDAARIYRRARPMLGEDDGVNAARLQEAERALMGTPITSEGNATTSPRRTQIESARKAHGIAALTGHSGPVNSVAFSTKAKRLLLASGGDDGTVRLWDPFKRAPIGGPLCGHGSGVSSVAFGTMVGGQLLLASASWDGTVRLWDPFTRAPIGASLPDRSGSDHSDGVSAVAFGTADGPLLLASAGDDQVVRLWHPFDCPLVGDPMPGRSGWVGSVAFGNAADGRLLLASAGSDGMVWLWDSFDRTRSWHPLSGHSGWVGSVAFGKMADGRLLLASAGSDGTVQLWDAASRAAVGDPLFGHSGGVSSVAFGNAADGRLLLASAGSDGTVQLWDPDSRAAVGDPVFGHSGGVSSVAFGNMADGRLLIASAGDDRTVCLWYPVSGSPSEVTAR
jgi:WD40 repeat protein